MRFLFLSLIVLAACAQPQSPQGPISDPDGVLAPGNLGSSELGQRIIADNARLDHELRSPGIVAAGLNETADLGEGLTVRPLAVIEDSRCAANVQCVWAGRLRLRANVSGAEAEITAGQPYTTSRGIVVLLDVVKPGAWADWPEAEVPRPAYRFGFRRG